MYKVHGPKLFIALADFGRTYTTASIPFTALQTRRINKCNERLSTSMMSVACCTLCTNCYIRIAGSTLCSFIQSLHNTARKFTDTSVLKSARGFFIYRSRFLLIAKRYEDLDIYTEVTNSTSITRAVERTIISRLPAQNTG